jgi:hypothetical protein
MWQHHSKGGDLQRLLGPSASSTVASAECCLDRLRAVALTERGHCIRPSNFFQTVGRRAERRLQRQLTGARSRKDSEQQARRTRNELKDIFGMVDSATTTTKICVGGQCGSNFE